jgi:hypothetical protein
VSRASRAGGKVYAAGYTNTSGVYTQSTSDQTALYDGPSTVTGLYENTGTVMAVVDTATGAKIVALTDSLANSSPPIDYANTHPVEAPISGDFSYAAYAFTPLGATAPVDVQVVRYDGTPYNAPLTLVPASEAPTHPTIGIGFQGYVMTWVGSMGVRAVGLDDALGVYRGPFTISSTPAQSAVSASWAGTPQRYLLAWASGGSIEVVITNSRLTFVVGPITIGSGTNPRATSDGNTFWVTWNDTASPTSLSTTHVLLDGTINPHPVAGTGGTMIDYTMIPLAQPVLVWVERNGSSPAGPLRIVPVCGL